MSYNMKLDSNWDVIPGKGLTRVGGLDYVAQNCKSRIQTVLGECFDETRGVPWNSSILGSTTITDAVLKDIISNAIIGTPDVVSITSMDIVREGRKATITFSATSKYGTFKQEVNA